MSPQPIDPNTIEVHRLDGSIHVFPGSATSAAIASTLKQLDAKGPAAPSRPLSDFAGPANLAIDVARPIADSAAAGVGATLAAPADPFTLGGASVAAGMGGY